MLCHTKHILYNLYNLTLDRVKVKWILGGLFIILQITAWYSVLIRWNIFFSTLEIPLYASEPINFSASIYSTQYTCYVFVALGV